MDIKEWMKNSLSKRILDREIYTTKKNDLTI